MRLALANSANSGLSKTSTLSFMHQPHQSEPVKSSMTNLCSCRALFSAVGRSSSHSSDLPTEGTIVAIATRRIAAFFMDLPIVYAGFDGWQWPKIRQDYSGYSSNCI